MHSEKPPPAYFGIVPVQHGSDSFWVVREVDIARLPFYDFWLASAVGSTLMVDPEHAGKGLIYYYDWQAFCSLFIRTGKHRYMP